MAKTYTTGEAARLCLVSQQTIIRCFDLGELEGFRVPRSKFRRITREGLAKFLVANGIPLGPFLATLAADERAEMGVAFGPVKVAVEEPAEAAPVNRVAGLVSEAA